MEEHYKKNPTVQENTNSTALPTFPAPGNTEQRTKKFLTPLRQEKTSSSNNPSSF
jgi:hypothetical protein